MFEQNLDNNIIAEFAKDHFQSSISQQNIIKLVDVIITHAIHKNVSDIHIEAQRHYYRIRFRYDGLLKDIINLPIHIGERIVVRLKVLADLDLTENRLPQDGRIDTYKMEQVDIRVSTCPCLFGQKSVLRLIYTGNIQLNLNAIGLLPLQKQLILIHLMQPQGLIIATGPTGSGKTVTLYTLLNYLNTEEKNIVTVEDPIEIELSHITQVNINEKINFGFPHALRAFLRQDPDILMIGEMRDQATAHICIQAALTGHLVLSTTHTKQAAEVLLRLRALGVAADQLVQAMQLIINQRLLRRLCEACKQVEERRGHFVIYRAAGCLQCHQGYQGRIGIFETITMTEKLRAKILNQAHPTEVLTQASQNNTFTLSDAATHYLQQGITSRAEINRVLGYAH